MSLRNKLAIRRSFYSLVTMLRLHPTTISLTGDDISLAMDHLESSKANTTETSLSPLNLPKPEQQKVPDKSSRIHKELQNLLANEEDCDRIQKHETSYIHNDELDGAFECLNIDSRYVNESSSEESESPNVISPIHLESSMGWPREKMERVVCYPSSGAIVQLSGIQHLDGIPVSLPEDDWYGSMSESYSMTDASGYQSDGGTDSSIPLLSSGGSIVSGPSSAGPQAPSPRGPATGISLRGGAAPDGMSSEYYVTSTCPEFVGPSEPFSLKSIYSDPSRSSTMVHPPTPVPIATDIISIEHSTLLTPPESQPNIRRRGLGVYDNDSNLEHIGSVFSPFTYSPEEPEFDTVVNAAAASNIVPSLPPSEWDDNNRDQEGGHGMGFA
ncbi:hypothetical protein BGX38DRAFT_1257526 [Terfezia claveryi]|nr:hypothetical protein BGX38DRAFT_1257526 [Terfezia claveryi]